MNAVTVCAACTHRWQSHYTKGGCQHCKCNLTPEQIAPMPEGIPERTACDHPLDGHTSHGPWCERPDLAIPGWEGRSDVFFNDFWHRPIAMDLDLTMSPEEMKALLLDNVQELCRIAFKAGYKKAESLYALEHAKGIVEQARTAGFKVWQETGEYPDAS